MQDAPTFSPAEGRRPEDFVPRDWKIGARADGDLNGDRAGDFVLQLVPEDYDVEGINAAPEAQALLILTAAGGGKSRRAALATKLLVPVVPQYVFDLSVKTTRRGRVARARVFFEDVDEDPDKQRAP